ncbi:hypothetical protein IP88_03305 [alpha proteobacterium AAP81b]|nr:hypothetical protein IP88_03305 [alpha proteobacterium AAP81b]
MNLPEPYRGTAGLPATLPPPGAVGYPMVDGAPDRVDTGSVLGALRRRRLLILGVFLACLGLALAVTLVLPRTWTASADIIVDPGQRELRVVPGEDAAQIAPDSSGLIETELETLRSRSLAGAVFDRLKLGRDSAFMALVTPRPSLIDRVQASLGVSQPLAPPTAADLRERGIDRLVGSVDAARVGTSYVLRISIDDALPRRAAALANAYVAAYVDQSISGKVGSNRDAVRVLTGRVEELRQQAQADTDAVQSYRIANNLLSKSATSLTEQEISTYNQSLASARAEAAEARSRLAAARAQLAGGGAGNVGEGAVSPVVQSLRAQRAQISARVADLSNRYVDSFPDLVAARRQLADIDTQIDAEVTRALQNLEARASAAQGRLASLEGSLGGARSTLRGNNSALTRLDGLERRAAASQALYDSYLNRYKETVAKSGAETPGARLLTAASPPKRPSAPSMPLNLALGGIVGLLLGTAAAIAIESLYRGLTAGADVERVLGVRYLGGVPLLKSLEHRATTAAETIARHPGGVYAEALRGVLAATRAGGTDRLKVIAITSAFPGEGKSTLAHGLARVAALGGERTILVDCDAVKSRIAADLGIARDRPGMAEAIAGGEASGAVWTDPVGGADILAFTKPLADGERLLDRGRLQRLVARLRESHDVIILDCGPLLAIAETREIATLADHVIVAAKWRTTRGDIVLTALKMLPWGAIRSVGVTLTMVDLKRQARLGGSDATAFYRKYAQYYG